MNNAQATSTFGGRLTRVLEFQGIHDHKRQAEMVAQCFGVKLKTAERYLQATTCPTFLSRRAIHFHRAAKDIGASAEWLFDGDGYSPEEIHMIKSIKLMTKWEKSKYLRYLIRLHNNDSKALRLGDMCASGQISRTQLFAAM